MIDMTKKKAKANAYIAEKYDRLSLAIPKGKREQYIQIAQKRGMSLTKLIVTTLDAEVEKENNNE